MVMQLLWKNSLAIPPVGKHGFTIQANRSTPRYTPKKNENRCPLRHSYANVHSTIFITDKK